MYCSLYLCFAKCMAHENSLVKLASCLFDRSDIFRRQICYVRSLEGLYDSRSLR